MWEHVPISVELDIKWTFTSQYPSANICSILSTHHHYKWVFSFVRYLQCAVKQHFCSALLRLLHALPRPTSNRISSRWECIWHRQCPVVCYTCERATPYNVPTWFSGHRTCKKTARAYAYIYLSLVRNQVNWTTSVKVALICSWITWKTE